MKKEYIIVGDTERFKDCLIYLAGDSLEAANRALHRMLNNPTESDKRLMEGHTNLRITEVKKEDCWWNDNCD